ncbi:MAG: MlaA family lipoprotein [Rhodanobacter sp.]
MALAPLAHGKSGGMVGALIFCVALGGCAGNIKHPGQPAAASTNDPSEHINRKIFAVNQAIDQTVIRPVAKGYTHLPHPIRSGVHDFVQNLGEPDVFINDVLQGNVLRSLNTGGRFVINSTIGLVGLLDVAQHMGMPHHSADLGQTFGVWGMGTGRTVEFPLFGSSNVRDSVGKVLDTVLNPLGQASNSTTVQTLDDAKSVGGMVDGRAAALPHTDQLELSDDYYAARRDDAAKRRAALVADGKVGAVRPAPAASSVSDDDD